MQKITETIFFITPDPQYALGLSLLCENLHVICNANSAVTTQLKAAGVGVFISPHYKKSARHLLSDELVLNYISAATVDVAHLLFFKLNFDVTSLLHRLQPKFKWRLLNAPCSITTNLENKIWLTQWAPAALLLPCEVALFKDLALDKLLALWGGVVLQFPTGNAGRNTFFIRDKDDFLKVIPPGLPKTTIVKGTPWLQGLSVTINGCVLNDAVLLSEPFIQLTGIPALTPYQGGTCGSVWQSLLAREEILHAAKITAENLRQQRFRGFFGLDFIQTRAGLIYLLECNPRLTTTVSIFSQLELLANSVPLFYFHLGQFLGKEMSVKGYQAPLLKGSQLVVRNTKLSPVRVIKAQPVSNPVLLMDAAEVKIERGFPEIAPGTEMFRWQSREPYEYVNPDYTLQGKTKTRLLEELEKYQ